MCWFGFFWARGLFLLLFLGGVFGLGLFVGDVVAMAMVRGDFFDAEGEQGGLQRSECGDGFFSGGDFGEQGFRFGGFLFVCIG